MAQDDVEDLADAQTDNSSDFVRSLARGLAVIKAFDRFTPAMTLSDVARKTGLPRAAAGRFLKTLVTLEYASFDGREYRLRPRVLELGMAYFSSFSFIEIANPILEAAARQVEEPCSMGVLDGAEVVYVARHTANRMMSISIALGNRYPATSTSLGRVLLGGLPDAELDALLDRSQIRQVTPLTVTDRHALREMILKGRSDGYCTAEGQLEVGIRSIAVPVRGRDGRFIAAINMGVPATRHTMESLVSQLLPVLRSAASEIEFAIRSRP